MIVAVIPCYNEGKTIGAVVEETRQYADKVCVIDNLSTDETALVAEKAGAEVWRCPWKGAGAATKMGLQLAKTHYGADTVVTLDGDGQHKPHDMNLMLKLHAHSKTDILIGSRFILPYRIPKYRKLGIDVINFAYNFGHKPITDSQCCFRVFSRKAMDIELTEHGFAFSVEHLIKARKQKLKIKELAVECIYHEGYSQNSTLNPIRHGLSVLWAVIKWRIRLAN